METRRNIAGNVVPETEAIDRITKGLIDEGKLIEAGWMGLRMLTIPPNAPQAQLDDMRMSFFAGAQHVFGSMMGTLDPDGEPTKDDLRRIGLIDHELREFVEDFKRQIK